MARSRLAVALAGGVLALAAAHTGLWFWAVAVLEQQTALNLTAGMAPGERNELMALTKRLVLERDIGVLFTEHSMDVVFAHADRMIVLARGELIAQGAPDAIRDDPKVQAVYFGTGRTFEKAAS